MASKLAERVKELEAELADALNGITAVEAQCAHIAVEWIEVGGIRIGLDAAGDAVRVEFPEILYGWVAE